MKQKEKLVIDIPAKNIVLKEEILFLKNLLSAARCPNIQCKNGVIYQNGLEIGSFIQEECQWCYLRQQALKEVGP